MNDNAHCSNGSLPLMSMQPGRRTVLSGAAESAGSASRPVFRRGTVWRGQGAGQGGNARAENRDRHEHHLIRGGCALLNCGESDQSGKAEHPPSWRVVFISPEAVSASRALTCEVTVVVIGGMSSSMPAT